MEWMRSYRRDGLYQVEPRHATEEEILWNHDRTHFDSVRATAGQSMHAFDRDTAATENTFDTATLAAGGLLAAIDEVMDGRAHNAFAMVRPPGHHAEADRAMGFCFFNNVAIGAHYLSKKHGLERVLIVDWDVHHGNGTQRSFYHDRGVLFMSAHQYPHYPGTGAASETGSGDAAGFTVNLPMPAGFGDTEYVEAFQRLIDPIARRFDPEFVLVSAGYDAHHLDPLGDMDVTEDGFGTLAGILLSVAEDHCGGRCVAVLEGGYSLDGLKEGVRATLDWMGNETFVIRGRESLAGDFINAVTEIQQPYWDL
jgi:acetoin utilization deacetylase AcuC-like enzyme